MATVRPIDGETIWVEYPEGKHFQAMYDANADVFIPKDGTTVAADDVANWSRQEHEDVDISDNPRQQKGALTRS
jgi:hypothetical protein